MLNGLLDFWRSTCSFKLCMIENKRFFLIIFKLWFLYKSHLRISVTETWRQLSEFITFQARKHGDNCQNWSLFKLEKRIYLRRYWSDKGLMRTVMQQLFYNGSCQFKIPSTLRKEDVEAVLRNELLQIQKLPKTNSF